MNATVLQLTREVGIDTRNVILSFKGAAKIAMSGKVYELELHVIVFENCLF